MGDVVDVRAPWGAAFRILRGGVLPCETSYVVTQLSACPVPMVRPRPASVVR